MACALAVAWVQHVCAQMGGKETPVSCLQVHAMQQLVAVGCACNKQQPALCAYAQTAPWQPHAVRVF